MLKKNTSRAQKPVLPFLKKTPKTTTKKTQKARFGDRGKSATFLSHGEFKTM